jgi:hypothetical protein
LVRNVYLSLGIDPTTGYIFPMTGLHAAAQRAGGTKCEIRRHLYRPSGALRQNKTVNYQLNTPYPHLYLQTPWTPQGCRNTFLSKSPPLVDPLKPRLLGTWRSGCLTFGQPSRCGTSAPPAPLSSLAHPPVTTPPTGSWKPSTHPPAACPDSKSVLSSKAISAAAASKPHSNNSYRWVPSTKAAGRPGVALPTSGPPHQGRSAWPVKGHTMNRPLKKQTTRSPCRSRFSSPSSHISTGVVIHSAAPPWVPRPQRAMRAAPTRATLPVLTPTWPRPASPDPTASR